MTVFFLMYRMNNEYTAKGEQPIHGILCLDEEDAAAKLHYLVREWQYFPGKLLTPQMLKENPEYYSRYISIGEYGGMELGNREASPYGCGTYRMFLILPDKEETWAISLTEVFSAYRIYINGDLAGQVGNPDEKNYKDRIMNRVYTFQASGTVEIVIAVADKDHIKSGIQYIPIFGSPVQVNMQRGLRVLGSGFAIAFCICIMFGVIMVHIRTRTKEFAIFNLVCICVVGYSIYPLVHSFFLLPTKPWYALETLSYYLILSCMLWLEECVMGKKRGRYLALLIDLWIVAAFLLEIFADRLPEAGILYGASWISEAVKWIAAVYMLANTFGETDCGYGKIVLAGTTVYACSLAADRIWPLYEPIIGGWFPETGGYEEICKKKEIIFQCQVETPEKTGIQDTDFCRPFGNLLENAIEAAELCPKGSSRFVRVQIRTKNNKLLIKEENSCTDPLRRSKTGFFSGKHSGQGIGTASIMEIASHYGGFADFQSENGIFRAEIFLRLLQKDTEDRLYG